MKTPFRPARFWLAPLRSALVARCVAAIAMSVFATSFIEPVTAQTVSSAEIRTSRALENVRANPLELEAFLTSMPKGTDLHMHLTGAIYAETIIRDAAEDQLCADPSRFASPIVASSFSTMS